MSYDRKLDQICPHLVIEEALYVNTDRQTVKPLRPIASGQSVVVRVNGVATVPPYGLHIPAWATGSVAGPFDVQPGVNDTLVVSVNNVNQTVIIKGGSHLSAEQVVDQLNQATQNAVFVASNKQRVRLRTRVDGPKATLLIRASGSTLAGTLGILTNRQWRGQTVYPGWGLVRDPRTLSDRPSRHIVFDRPFAGRYDYVEISYTTVRQECRRCGGLGIENDWLYGQTGEVVQARDEALLIQELLKAVYTSQGSNPFHTWYGSNIIRTIGRKLSSSGLVQNLIVSDIGETFRRWQSIKRRQEEDVGQFVSDAEYPFRLLNVILEQSQMDPTVVYVTCTVQNRSQQPIEIERGIKLPQPFDLMGSTAQEGVFRQSLSDYALTG